MKLLYSYDVAASKTLTNGSTEKQCGKKSHVSYLVF